MDVEKDLVKLNIKKLRVLCTNLGIKFKSKWKKAEYINELKKKISENGENALRAQPLAHGVVDKPRSYSLELPAQVPDTDSDGAILQKMDSTFNYFQELCSKCNDAECLCKRKASTPISKPEKKKKPELCLGTGVHSYFQEICGQDAPQPDSISNWNKDPTPSTIPMITSVEVYDYLIQRKSVIDNTSNKHFKGFEKAVTHLEAQDIVGGLETSLVYSQFLYIKSRCYPSMKAESYRVVVVLDSLDRNICGGACECTIGKSGACSHVGALLLYVENYTKLKGDEFKVSCTSRPCAWNAPKTRKMVCKPLTEISFNRPRLYVEKKQQTDTIIYSKFDPRHPEDRVSDPERLKQAILDLSKIHPKTGALHFWDLESSIEETPSNMNLELETTVQLDEELEIHHDLQQLIYTPAMIYRDMEEDLRNDFVSHQVVTQEIVEFIENKTKEQSTSNLWKELRRGRITSSLFGRILSCREKTFPSSLVDTILNPSKLDSYARLPPAMVRGQKLEPIAREAYEKKFNVTVEKSGLSLMSEYAFIGASGDGIITDATEDTKGILEIKCPCSIKGTDITKMKISSIVDSFPSFCLQKKNGKITLSRKSPYYAQVQGEMAVKKLKWADFVVYNESSEDGIFKERILFDQPFWENELLPKILRFFTKYITPFLINELD